MSHNSKHKHKTEDKYSHSNVFRRLGENNSTKEEAHWHSHHASKSDKSLKSTTRHGEDYDRSSRKSDRWLSSNKEHSQQVSSSKSMKTKIEGYHDDYKQDHYRYDRVPRQQLHEDISVSKKHRSPSELTYEEEYVRAKKRKHKSPSAASLSLSPQFSSRHEAKRTRQKSPEIDLNFHSEEKHYERGRSRERKNKKFKDAIKTKEAVRDSKVSHVRDSYKESSDYGDCSSEFQYKKHRSLENYQQPKPSKHESKRLDQYKKKHVSELSSERELVKTTKKSHFVAHKNNDSSFEEKHRLKSDAGKSSKHYQKHQKVEKIYTSDESGKVSHKKSKSAKVDSYLLDEPKPKKKIKAEKETRCSSPYYSKQVERNQREKKNKEICSEDESSLSRSISPPKHKVKESKHHKEEIYSDVESDDVIEKKVKARKKKKQKFVEEVELVKKKKIKSQKNEDLSSTKKKSIDKFEQEETREKAKKLKKKKRLREEPLTSQSDSESEEVIRSRKHHHRTEKVDNDWETVDDIDDSSSRTSKKHSDYDASKPRRVSSERVSHHKRPKLEQTRRGSPEDCQSRSVSRSRHSSILSSQPSKRRSERSPEREPYLHGNREKKTEMIRNDRQMRDDFIDPPRDRHYSEQRERHSEYKIDLSMEDVRYHENRGEGEKPYYDKKVSRYHEKTMDSSYESKPYSDKRNYEPRNHDMRHHEKKMQYNDMNTRDSHRDNYPLESRKSHDYIDERGDARNRYDSRHKPMTHPHDSRSHEIRDYREPRHPDWQPERGRRPRDPNVGFSDGTQRISSWVDGRDGGKLRIETREPQVFRKSHDLRAGRIDERDERMPRMDARGSRDVRQDIRDMHTERHDARNQIHLRQEVREPPKEKWLPDRPPNEIIDVRHRGHQYNRDKNVSQDHSGHYSEKRTPFYREVRQSRENRHLDLGIEVTIHDDGGRSSLDNDKNRKQRVSPVRKVSSYETSRSRERPTSKVPRDRSLSTHRDRSGSETLRLDRAVSPHSGNSASRYQQRGKESHQSIHGHSRPDARDRTQRMTETKPGSGSFRDGGKMLKHDRLKPDIERDHSRSLSGAERSRDSSAADRERSRDSSQTDRGRASQRETQYSQNRTDKKSSKTDKSHKESSKSSSDRRKSDRSKPSGEKVKSSSEKKKSHSAESVDVLDVKWEDLGSPEKKAPSSQLENSSILKRFTPGNILLRMGVSSNLLPPETLEKIRKKCDEESEDSHDALPLVFNRGLGALNRVESLRQWSWANAFKSRDSFTARLTSYADAKYRRRILGITEDLRFPPQPPQIINAKSYSSSMKHYLSKTKLTVGGG